MAYPGIYWTNLPDAGIARDGDDVPDGADTHATFQEWALAAGMCGDVARRWWAHLVLDAYEPFNEGAYPPCSQQSNPPTPPDAGLSQASWRYGPKPNRTQGQALHGATLPAPRASDANDHAFWIHLPEDGDYRVNFRDVSPLPTGFDHVPPWDVGPTDNNKSTLYGLTAGSYRFVAVVTHVPTGQQREIVAEFEVED